MLSDMRNLSFRLTFSETFSPRQSRSSGQFIIGLSHLEG